MRKLLVALGGLFLCLAANAQNVAIGSLTASSTDCSTAGSCISLQFDSNDVGSASIQLSGTFTATVQFEASSDKGTTWVAISGTPLNSTTAVTSATTANTWKFNVASITNIRARASAWTSAPTVVIRSSKAVANAMGGGGGSGTPGGSNPQVQYNNAGAFGGVTGSSVSGANITWGGTSTATQFITSGTAAGCLTLNEAVASGLNTDVFCAPSGAFSNASFVLPAADGTAGQFLKTDASGNLTFAGSATAPITFSSSSVIACATCATTTNGGAISGTAPVTVSAAGVIACATCATTLDTVGDPAAAKSFNFANANFLTFGTSGSSATGANNLVTITDGTNNSGTGAVTKLTSASGSNGFPLTVSLTGANTAAVTDIATFTQGGAPGTVAGIGLAGAGYHFTAQPGGTTSTTATNGGAGGGYSLTGGIGGATLSGNATGGTGGGHTLTTGAGGASSGSNANSNGGDITLTFGAAGTGGGGAAGRLGQLSANTLSVVTTTGGITLQPLSGQNINFTNGTGGITKITGGSTAANNDFQVKYGAASPTGDAIQVQNSGGTVIAGISSTGTNSATFNINILNSSGATINSGAPVKWNTGTADTAATDATVADTVVIGVNEGSCTNTSVCRIAVQGLIADAISDGACSIGNWVQASNTSGDVHCVGTIGAVGTTIGIAANAVNGAGFHFIIVHE